MSRSSRRVPEKPGTRKSLRRSLGGGPEAKIKASPTGEPHRHQTTLFFASQVKIHDGLPLVVLQFVVQQINCVRDRSGAVVEGAPDDIQSVYYVWAVEQQFDPETYTARWMLREMAVRGRRAEQRRALRVSLSSRFVL